MFVPMSLIIKIMLALCISLFIHCYRFADKLHTFITDGLYDVLNKLINK